jgi:RNA polymerase sigma-70 factor (ECF subfamily)
MTGELNFDQLIQRLRAGDHDAADSLVRQFEPEVRRFIRFRLTSPPIRRFIDSLDVSQSVLARFFVELERGTIEVAGPDQLRRLLMTMARNKLYDHARTQKAAKRDARRLESEPERLEQVADSATTPSEQLAAAELVEAVRSRLSTDELYLVEQRMDGRTWDDLAQELQSTVDAVRKRMCRAIDRAAKELGVIEC